MKKSLPILIISLMIILAGCGEKVAKEEESKHFEEELKSIYVIIDEQAAEDEEIVFAYLDEWYNTLNNSLMNKYKSLVVASVQTVFQKYLQEGTFDKIDKNQEEIEKRLAELDVTGDKYQKVYVILVELHNAQKAIYELASNPRLGNGTAGDYEYFFAEVDQALENYKDVRDKLDILL